MARVRVERPALLVLMEHRPQVNFQFVFEQIDFQLSCEFNEISHFHAQTHHHIIEGETAGDTFADETAADETQQDDQLGSDSQNDDGQSSPPNMDDLQPPQQQQPGQDQSDPAQADETQADETQADEQQADETQNDEAQEGSGGGEGSFFDFGFPSFPSIFRSLSGYTGFGGRSFDELPAASREGRQLFSTCTDRITMPCIIEDFIGMGYGDVQSCSPVHCGSSLCRAGVKSCRIETSVTPFHIGVRFGDGKKISKGGPEDNIGACIRYKQLPC